LSNPKVNHDPISFYHMIE